MSPETDADANPLPPAAGDTRRYVVGECVGTGGLGAVHRAWDAHLGRWVAIKRLAPDEGGTEAAAARLRREANALAALQHPHIVTVHDVGTDEEGPFVVMEFIEGETLDAIAGRAPLDLESFGVLVVQTLGAVEAAHRAGLLHRDLKPGNIMLAGLPDSGFTVKVLDFGLAKFAPRPATQTLDQGHSLLGSIFFMAPEQFRREPLDARMDLYALGAIFYFSLTGMHPFDGETTAQVMAAHLEGRLLRPLARLRPDVPPPLAAWVERLMSRVPTDRPASAAAALALARPFLAGVPPPLGDGRLRTGTVRVAVTAGGHGNDDRAAAATSSPARRWLWPTVAVALLLLAAGGFLAFRTMGPPVATNTSPTVATTAGAAGAGPAVPPSSPSSLSPAAAPPLTPPGAPSPALPPAGTSSPVAAASTSAPAAVPLPPAAPTVFPRASMMDPLPPASAPPPRQGPPAGAPSTPVAPAPPVDGAAVLPASDIAALRARMNETVTVGGTPVATGQSRNGSVFYLNFDRRPHMGLAVVCFGGAGSTVRQEDLQAFVGKPVTVRGKLGDYKGDLQIIIQSPADVKLAATP